MQPNIIGCLTTNNGKIVNPGAIWVEQQMLQPIVIRPLLP